MVNRGQRPGAQQISQLSSVTIRNKWDSLDNLASLALDTRRPVVTCRLNKTWVGSPFADPFLRFQRLPVIAIWHLGCFSRVRRNLCDIRNLLPFLPWLWFC